MTKNKAGSTVYIVTLPYDRFVFDDLDLSQFDVEQEMGAYPYGVIRVDYDRATSATTPRDDSTTLGWARFKVYASADASRQSAIGLDGISTNDKWRLVVANVELPLLPGPASSKIDLHPATADANTHKASGM